MKFLKLLNIKNNSKCKINPDMIQEITITKDNKISLKIGTMDSFEIIETLELIKDTEEYRISGC